MASTDFLYEDRKYLPGERQYLLYQYLLKNTCKGHTVTRKQILDHLSSYGIVISVNTLYADLEIIKSTMKLDLRFDPHVHNRGAGGYWVANPTFRPSELRLIIDGIQSLQFITQKKAAELSEKVKDLADIHTQRTLNRQAFVSNRARSMNEGVIEDANKIYQAISDDGKISFLYFHYTPDKQKRKEYSKGGERYTVSPHALLWNKGNLYLYAYDGKKFRYFRVDRMENIRGPLAVEREGKEEFKTKDITHPRAKVFDMYGGDEYDVRIRFHNRAADQVIEQFGSDIMMIPADGEHFIITVPVEISPPFFAWVATLGRMAKILGPEPVVKKMKEFIQKAADMYKDEGKM